MMSPLPGAIATKQAVAPSHCRAFRPRIVDENGKDLPQGRGGMLCVDHPWPGMLRGIWGDPERFQGAVLDEGARYVSDG